jgi:hypothetical protein
MQNIAFAPALSQQFAQLTMNTQQASPMNYSATTRIPSNASLLTPATAPVTNPLGPSRGGYLPYRGGRGTYVPRTQMSHAQILERATSVPQRPNTETGMRQYEVDVNAWHRTYGTDGVPSLERPYPLRPGTAVLGSGECYSCGIVTDPTHLSSQCTATSQL